MEACAKRRFEFRETHLLLKVNPSIKGNSAAFRENQTLNCNTKTSSALVYTHPHADVTTNTQLIVGVTHTLDSKVYSILVSSKP